MPAEPTQSGRARRLLPAALMCVALGGLGGLWAGTVHSASTAAPVRFIPPRESVQDLRLRDQDGRWVTLHGQRGQVVVLTFLYSTCKDLCPAQAGEIGAAVGAVGGRGVQVLGVSVDPVGDTPKRAQHFLAAHGLDVPIVHFLVGTRAELAPVWARYGIAPLDATPGEAAAAAASYDLEEAQAAGGRAQGGAYRHPDRPAPPGAAREPYPSAGDLSFRGRARHVLGAAFEHSAYVLLIDKHGRGRVGFPFEQLSAAALAQDMRVLLREP